MSSRRSRIVHAYLSREAKYRQTREEIVAMRPDTSRRAEERRGLSELVRVVTMIEVHYRSRSSSSGSARHLNDFTEGEGTSYHFGGSCSVVEMRLLDFAGYHD
jgi:hypothetical protein